MEVEEAQKLWSGKPGWLNTASYGLPPRPAYEALQNALEQWREGSTGWETWSATTDEARARFAALIGADAADVAIGAQVSQMLAPVACSLPRGASVLVPEQEFTSAVFPWAVHEARGVSVRSAPLDDFAGHISEETDVVCFSLVQSGDGRIADYRSIVTAARHVGAMVVVDATQAAGWYPFDGRLADVVVVSAYKWLMAPRGTGFVYIAPRLRDSFTPVAAGWFAGEDVEKSFYGLPLRLAKEARAFDLSPAWHPWVATAPALKVIQDVGVDTVYRHNTALANRFLAGLGHPPRESAIVTLSSAGAGEALTRAGIRTAGRNGAVRVSFHLYNTESDVDMALDALRG
ncbi:aminotransferase class V-fold PLP-dependent enzyme [Phytohabitans sp. LJ34]|uniref:aminotransferase class V-fold PLP-dependent enzyme n=1 Tax=Phytohabitans sp. LJ34 TaxID=3452217 RepID=UPI003F8983A3